MTAQGAREGTYLRLSLFCAAMLIGIGIYLPFFPVWLAARGLGETDIGLVLAAPSLVRLFVNPPLTALADRRGAVPMVLACCAFATCFFYALLGFTFGFWPIFIGVIVIACAQGPIIPLSDTLIFSRIRLESARPGGTALDYASIRAWGSAVVFAGMILGGPLVGLAPKPAIVWILTGLAAITALAALAVARSAPDAAILARAAASAAPGTAPGRSSLWLGVTVIAAAGLIQASHGQLYAFATLDWQAQGFSDGFIGLLWASGVLSEVLFFLLARRLFGGESRAMTFLVLGGLAAALRWAVMVFTPGALALTVLNLLHGLTFAATHLGSVTLLAAFVAPQHRAQAQGWLAAVVSVSLFAVTAMSGRLHLGLGASAYGIMAAIALAGFGLAILASLLREHAHGRRIVSA